MGSSYEPLKSGKIVAIHQPNYFPWLGFFYKVYASDVFVFHDNVEHSKRYPTRRTRIRKAADSEESCWLTVPLKKHSDFTSIKDLEIDHSQNWQEKHLRKLKNSYAGTDFFPVVFPKIESWLAESGKLDSLADLNIFLVKKLLEDLGIPWEIYRSSELPVAGYGSIYNVRMVKYLGVTHYLSGKGGGNYQTECEFAKEGIALATSGFGEWLAHNNYPQSQGTKSLSGLSVVDALFNLGVEGVMELFAAVGPIDLEE